MGFKVGDRVVYPHHGAAVIKKKETRVVAEEKVEYFVLQMAHGDLTLSVPVNKADEVGMRPPISVEDVEDVLRLLGKRDVREPSNWSRRFKNHQEKLKSGDVYQVAEVVRNLALRESARGLSAGEKSMLERARVILASELSIAWVSYTYPFNLTRSPAGTVCAGLTGDGLPVGLQVIGPQHADQVVLRTIAAIEQALGLPRPPRL